MVKKVMAVPVIAGLALILILMAVFAPQYLGQKQTVLGVSLIPYDDGTQKWTAAVVGSEEFVFYKGTLTESAGGKLTATSNIRVKVNEGAQYCEYNLRPQTGTVGGVTFEGISFGAKSFPYFTLQTPSKNAVYFVTVSKEDAAGIVYKTTEKSISLKDGSGNVASLSFTDPKDSNGNVIVSNWGATLANAAQDCDSATGAVLFQSSTGEWKLLDATEFALVRNGINTDWKNILTTFIASAPSYTITNFLSGGTLDSAMKNWLWDRYFGKISPPSTWRGCAAGTTNCGASISVSGDGGYIQAALQRGTLLPGLTIAVDSAFADGILVVANDGTCEPTLTVSANSLKQSEHGVATVKCKNIGKTEDSFVVSLLDKAGVPGTSPIIITGSPATTARIKVGDSDTVLFDYMGFEPAKGQLCAVARSQSTGKFGPSVCSMDITTTAGAVPIPVPPPNITVTPQICPTEQVWDAEQGNCVAKTSPVLPPSSTFFINPCPPGYSYDGKVCLPTAAPGANETATCSEKVDAVQCGALDLTCPINKMTDKIGCVVSDITGGLLVGGAIILGAIAILTVGGAYVLTKRRRKR